MITVTDKSGNKSIRFLKGVSSIGQSFLQDTPNIVTEDRANSATSNAPGVLHWFTIADATSSSGEIIRFTFTSFNKYSTYLGSR